MNAVVLSIVGYTLQTKVTFDQRDFFFFFIRIYLSLPVYFDTDTSKVSRANPFPLDSRESGGGGGGGGNEARESLSHHRSLRVFLHSFAAVSSDKVGQCLTSVFLHLVLHLFSLRTV